jgi:hypothetical protein
MSFARSIDQLGKPRKASCFVAKVVSAGSLGRVTLTADEKTTSANGPPRCRPRPWSLRGARSIRTRPPICAGPARVAGCAMLRTPSFNRAERAMPDTVEGEACACTDEHLGSAVHGGVAGLLRAPLVGRAVRHGRSSVTTVVFSVEPAQMPSGVRLRLSSSWRLLCLVGLVSWQT